MLQGDGGQGVLEQGRARAKQKLQGDEGQGVQGECRPAAPVSTGCEVVGCVVASVLHALLRALWQRRQTRLASHAETLVHVFVTDGYNLHSKLYTLNPKP